MIKVIVFDFWNTLVRNTCGRSLPSMIRNALGLKDMDAQQFTTYYDESFCLRKSESAHDALRDLCTLCRITPAEDVYEKAKKTIQELLYCVEPFEETFEVLEKLKKTHKLVVLSNTSHPALKAALEKVPLQEHVDWIVASYDHHMIKPDPRLFSKIAKTLRIAPEEILVVGDNIFTDVYGAKAVGFNAVLLDRDDEFDYTPKIRDLRGVYEFL